MILAVAAIIGGLGLISIIQRKTLMGILVGVQLLTLGAAMMFVLSGISSGVRVQGHIFALFITLGGVAQLVSGYALAIRMFYLKSDIKMEDLRSLKQ